MSKHATLARVNTLAWVNDMRAQYGIGEPLDTLPKGVRDNVFECPLARALGETAVTARLWFPHFKRRTPDESWANRDRDPVALPVAARNFIDAFDANLYPELIA